MVDTLLEVRGKGGSSTPSWEAEKVYKTKACRVTGFQVGNEHSENFTYLCRWSPPKYPATGSSPGWVASDLISNNNTIITFMECLVHATVSALYVSIFLMLITNLQREYYRAVRFGDKGSEV